MSADASAVDTGATAPRPRAVVFAVMPGGHGEPGEEEPLNEIKELLSSADMDWVADVLQRKERPHPHSYLGKGKLVELAEAVKESGATVAVCEDDLTPGQVAAVLDAVDVDVLDRTELILTVFSKHAHSMEGTMQVHLAQLEYELTRMRGKGHILSRLGAGVNMRGPGETKLEVDRRVVRQRIQTLRRRIEHMAKTRRTQRARRVRAAVPLNAGKSTLLNALTDADVSVRDRLFETLDPTSRSYRFRDRDYVLTDTVGFIRKLPHSLVDAFASTLEETTLADVILVVADAHLEPSEIEVREQTVAEVLDMLGAQAPRIVVFNKIDLSDPGDLARLRALYPEAELVAAARGEGLGRLQERLADFFDRALRPVRLLFPYAAAADMHRLRGVASDVHEEHTPDGVVFTARLPVAEAGRYARFSLDTIVVDDETDEEDELPEPDASETSESDQEAPGDS
jgi:GTP-binding protein HflX